MTERKLSSVGWGRRRKLARWCSPGSVRLCWKMHKSIPKLPRRAARNRSSNELQFAVPVAVGVTGIAQELDEVKCEAAVAAVGASDSGPSAACPCYNMKSVKPDQPMLC